MLNVVTHNKATMRILNIILILLLFTSCMNNNQTTKKEPEKQSKASEIVFDNSNQPNKKIKKKLVIKKTKFIDDSVIFNGYLGLLQIDNFSGDVLTIYNPDSTIFSEIHFAEPESKEYYDYLDSLVSPFNLYAYHPDYALFTFKANISEDFYEIETKDEEVKFISRESKICKFLTWSEFVVSEEYVSIKSTSYGDSLDIYINPTDSSESFKLPAEADYLLNAVNMKKEWIQFKAEPLMSDTTEPFSGWIKWRDEKKMLIDFWFLL